MNKKHIVYFLLLLSFLVTGCNKNYQFNYNSVDEYENAMANIDTLP